ncbi:MAG: hypothetical protein LQ337_008793, partial [Flavoplaca oasis]
DVEVEGGETGWNESEWKEDLMRLKELVERRDQKSGTESSKFDVMDDTTVSKNVGESAQPGAAKVEAGNGWSQQMIGASALLGCILVWGGTSFLDKPR